MDIAKIGTDYYGHYSLTDVEEGWERPTYIGKTLPPPGCYFGDVRGPAIKRSLSCYGTHPFIRQGQYDEFTELSEKYGEQEAFRQVMSGF